ncbi:DUF3667 domain-containing protein [Sphingobium sp. SYK-6]|uniref:DUF3667 domain-containing protein n=1 Tax=Sphingobium sp. (strain NBRC 103272 / SYK-6) TaxID=627192 RepID=UPI00031C04D8|nr:DUF3667 domain-containing protein [Sphingobium sp. SYK-6]
MSARFRQLSALQLPAPGAAGKPAGAGSNKGKCIMASGIEAVGEAMTGAVVAGAVEPGHGEGGAAVHGDCLNCGTPLKGHYCHACGQNGHLHRSLGGFAHDIMHGVLHFEGKFWNTLPLLLFKPGELTRRYIAGERAKFVSPVALFLFSVFLMFAVVNNLAGSWSANEYRSLTRANVEQEIGDLEERATRLESRIEKARAAGEDTAELEQRLASTRENIEATKLFADKVKPAAEAEKDTFKTGWAKLDKGIAAVNDNPDLFLYRMQTSAYKFSWLLIPLSLPFVWILFFWKRQYRFYDHLVFVTLSITFMSLLVTTLTILGAVGVSSTAIALAAMIVPPVHIYKQVRGAYRSRRITALFRASFLVMSAFVALSLFLTILLVMGIMK